MINARNTLKVSAPNHEAYELDMDLRTEKEKQRGALIKLRELSTADPDFSTSCQVEVDRLGLTVPTLTRLEMRSANTTSGSKSRSRSASRVNGLTDMTASQAGSRAAFYRRRQSSGNSFQRSVSSSGRAGAPSSVGPATSMLVMELSEVAQGHNARGGGGGGHHGGGHLQLPMVN